MNQYKYIKPITPREQQVLHLIAYEYSTKQIASELYVSTETINSHRKNIKRKLDVKNVAGMVRVAMERRLLQVSQLLMIIFLFSTSQGRAQVTNDNINYQLRTSFGQWFLETDDGTGGASEMAFNFRAKDDTNGMETDLRNQGSDGNGSACIAFIADCEGFCQSPFEFNPIMKDSDSEGLVDMHFIVFEDDDSPPSCSSTDRSFEREKLALINVKNLGEPNKWLGAFESEDDGAFNAGYQALWRYTHGTKNSPLDFGTINGSSVITHINSNRKKPAGAENNTGYESDWNMHSSADVTYEFEIDNKALDVLIYTHNNNFDTEIYIYKGNNLITSDDNSGSGSRDSQILKNLCPGTYQIVVEGINGAEGDFEIYMDAIDISHFSGGTISNSSASTQICNGAKYDFSAGQSMSHITVLGGDITYQWQTKLATSSQWSNISGKTDNFIQLSNQTMGATNVDYRRVVNLCGTEAYSNPLTMVSIANSINGQFIEFDNSNNHYIRKGSNISKDVINDVLATGSPAPLTYEWVKSINGKNDTTTAINGANRLTAAEITQMSFDSNEPPGEQDEFSLYRVATNNCGVPDNSNELTFQVIAANGSISGKVQAPNGGSDIRGVIVCATIDPTYGDAIDRGYAQPTCDTTDAVGNYSLNGLYTGNPNNTGVQYLVEATFLDHKIIKSTASVEGGDSVYVIPLTNNNSSPSNNFEDITVISVTGNVYHDFNNQNYGKQGVQVFAELLIDGIAVPKDSTTTDALGNYALSLPNPGEYILRPEFKRIVPSSNGPLINEHMFAPPTVQMEIIENSEVDFIDQSYEKIVVKYGGACGRSIGTARIDVIDRDNNNKLLANQTINGDFEELILPARTYNIDILATGYNIAGGASESVVEGQLTSMANDSAIIEFEVDTININIKETPMVVVTGFDDLIDSECGNGTNLFDLPVIEQGKSYPNIVLDVYEGPVNTCPLDSGALQVSIGINTLPTLPILNGKAEGFLLKGGLPQFNAPYTHNMEIKATDLLNQQSDPFVQAFVTTGSKSKGTDFVSISPELPFMILHDPPTDEGYSFWESTRSFSTTSTTYKKLSEGGGAWASVQLGAEFSTGVSVFGATFDVKTEALAYGEGDLQASQNRNSSESTSITTTITDLIETEDGINFIGDDADIVMTMIMTKTFSESDFIVKDGCDINKFTDYGISKDSVSAISYRTIRDIKEEIIPDLQDLLENEPDPAKTQGFAHSISQWRQIISDNEAEKMNLILNTPADSVERVAIGSGVGLSSSITVDSMYSSTFEYIMEIEEEVATGARVIIAGFGGEGKVYGKFKQEFTIEPSIDENNVSSISTGYRLDDDDVGDQYLIAVYRDSRYGTPIFNVEGGRSSCPYVPYSESMPLAKTKPFSVTASTVSEPDVDPIIGTSFEFNIHNESDDDLTFRMIKDFTFGRSSEVRINSSLDNEVAIDVSANDSTTVLVSVKRTVFSGPDNEIIKIKIAPNCSGQFEINNQVELQLNVGYVSTISPITIVDPSPGQIVNIASNNILKIKMTDYVKSDFDNAVMQYTLQGSGSLKDATGFNIANVGANFNNNAVLGTIKDWDVSEIKEDGLYELKLKTTKNTATGSNGSDLVSIVIDRQKPIIFGTPEPIDDHYDQTANDVLSVSYNENVKASASGMLVMIEDLVNGGDPIAATATIFENQVRIVDNIALNSLPASAYRITLSGIEDLAGNPADTYRWVFLVGDYNDINLSCISELFVSNNNLDQNSINVTSYKAKLISSDGVVGNYGTTTYVAEESVTLEGGFEITAGGEFIADIENCTNE